MKRTLLWPFILLVTLFAVGCTPPEPETAKAEEKPVAETPVVEEPKPAMDVATATAPAQGAPALALKIDMGDGKPKTAGQDYVAPKPGEPIAVLETNMGMIVLSFFPEKAPKHVLNFLGLAKDGFYDGTKFHRVIPGFMIQGGDPNSKDNSRDDDGMGGNVVNGSEVMVEAEFNDTKHTPGILSMARSNDPNSASSQFFIVHGAADFLDGQYSAFGQVVSGMDVVDKVVNLKRDERDNPLEQNPAILKSVKLYSWPAQ